MSERLGILGGTFDPIHTGHLVMAVEALHQVRLDRVLLVVARDPWQKSGRVVAPAPSRLAMVEAAVAEIDGVRASDVELLRDGPTYTADTVAELASADRELFLILGADAVAGLPTWNRLDEIRDAVTLVTVNRGCDTPPSPSDTGWRSISMTIPRLDIASTDIRHRLRHGAPIAGLVPEGAIRVIRELGLYTHQR